jgi:nucleoside-diphosphate-sugar epimerase
VSGPIDVLVTGARGFVGQALLRSLRDEQPDLSVLGIGRSDVDLVVRSDIQACLAATKPHTVVHLAAALPGRNSGEQARQWRDTFSAGRNLLEACVDAGVAHILMAGSVAELGDCGGALGPDTPRKPTGLYGLCKALLFEVAAFTARTQQIRLDWFRPFTVYGPGQQGAMLVPAAFAAAATGTPEAFTDGQQERDFLFVEDLASWIVAGIGAPQGPPRRNLRVHHVGTGIPTPVCEVLRRIAALFPGADLRVGALPRRPGEPARQIALTEPAPWPWEPRTTLDDGLYRTAQWWRARSEREKAEARCGGNE